MPKQNSPLSDDYSTEPIDEVFEVDTATFKEDTEYVARCTGFEKVTSENTGNDSFKFDYLVLALDSQASDWVSLTPQARWRLTAVLKAFNIDVSGDKSRFRPGDVLDKYVVLTFKEREYEGTKRMGVNKIRAATPAEISQFSASPV